jgi:hypothetical protein
MFDVSVLRYNRPLLGRRGDAKTRVEEFRVYGGVPHWFCNLVRVLKLSCAALLVIGVWIPMAALLGGLGLVVLMGGAITMHINVRDPILKSVLATGWFLVGIYVVYARWPTGLP